jgi:hypothetical protein
MAGGSRPKRALAAKATCPGGTIGAAGATETGGVAAAGGGDATPPPGAVRLAPGAGGVISVGLAGGGTLGMSAGGIGGCSPGIRLRVAWADSAAGQASAKIQEYAAKRQARAPSLPDPIAIVAILSNEIAAISSRSQRGPRPSRWPGSAPRFVTRPAAC